MLPVFYSLKAKALILHCWELLSLFAFNSPLKIQLISPSSLKVPETGMSSATSSGILRPQRLVYINALFALLFSFLDDCLVCVCSGPVQSDCNLQGCHMGQRRRLHDIWRYCHSRTLSIWNLDGLVHYLEWIQPILGGHC